MKTLTQQQTIDLISTMAEAPHCTRTARSLAIELGISRDQALGALEALQAAGLIEPRPMSLSREKMWRWGGQVK